MQLERPIRWVNRLVPQDPRYFWHPDPGTSWEKCTFTVPAGTAEARVQEKAPEYRNAAGRMLEKQGYHVLRMTALERDTGLLAATVDADRTRYFFWAQVRRRPVDERVDVPDRLVPQFQEAGYTLQE